MTQEDTHKLIRLYVPQQPPEAGAECALSDRQTHYLRNVMRCTEGDHLRVFDGTSGEWLAQIKEVSKKNVAIGFLEKIHEQKASPDIHIVASVVKKDPFDLMVEKASELGARAFYPVTCERTVIQRVNDERLQTIAVEAAEQCERLDLMRVAPLQKLETVLNSWGNKGRLMFCLERAEAPMLVKALQADMLKPPMGLLIGPEGGFTPAEVEMIRAFDFVTPVSLGPRILRAETALIAALACVQAVAGDWKA
jgi:16S rRNA (uracil1498-N3)-methyltransferase